MGHYHCFPQVETPGILSWGQPQAWSLQGTLGTCQPPYSAGWETYSGILEAPLQLSLMSSSASQFRFRCIHMFTHFLLLAQGTEVLSPDFLGSWAQRGQVSTLKTPVAHCRG